jgi:hypothetical protein
MRPPAQERVSIAPLGSLREAPRARARTVLDGAQRVGDHAQAADAEREQPPDVRVVQRHLDALVVVLVVHEVDHLWKKKTCWTPPMKPA